MQLKLHKNCMVSISTQEDGNMAYHVPLRSDDVKKNRINFAKKIGLDIESVAFMNQTHSSDVAVVDSVGIYESDAMITQNKKIALAVMVADCIPIAIYDPVTQASAVIHAGRVGTFNNILANTCKKLQTHFDSKMDDLIIYMGASIGQCCYEVSHEMVKIVTKSFGKDFVNGKKIDLQGINRYSALRFGVKAKNIIDAKLCTKCNSDKFYSYRVEQEKSGRFILVVKINSCNNL